MKNRDSITDYFIQATFYSLAWEELTGEKIEQIGGDLIIIHFAWSATLLRGAVSVTSLKEMADYHNCSVRG